MSKIQFVRRFGLFTAGLLVIGCAEIKEAHATPENLDQAYSTLESFIPTGHKLLFVCGASTGKTHSLYDLKWKWEDRVEATAIAVVKNDAGAYDIIFKDSDGNVKSSLEDGDKVQEVFSDSDGKLILTVITGKISGIETHNFAPTRDEGWVDLWTLNMQHDDLIEFRAVGALKSNCKRYAQTH